ncbi:hypothetical protein PVAND_005942 [Polypedilum vanderplanki]|uniref:Uncharacterized protein n=1 Tax=Polypedilum vanderplanki TaxID=319348 RepID=A0A9J6C2I1_POLVA|nr:hypothetical protein PVAND_005942 [Polypedilum vanderplanki]
MASSRQNYSSQVLNSQSTANSTSTTNAKEKSSHKSESKLKHDKNSSSTSGHIPMSCNTIINNMSKRKGTSFQITSVSVNSNAHHQQQQGQRNSTDNNNGDDSCDDLDDSHTDDNISRITDYETPSISETFSGEDVFFTQPIAFGTAPVIPTSSQYGLAIVGPDLVGGDGSNHLTDVHVSVTDAGINIMGGPISGGNKDVDHKNERFKVVKIESTEPFKRGRWMCMDYLDHTTLQDDGIDGKIETRDEATKDDISENSAGSKQQTLLSINNGDVDHIHSDNEELDHEVNRINSNNINSIKIHHQQDIVKNPSQQHHPQTMTTIPNFNDHSNNINNNNQVAQSMPQGHIQTILSEEFKTHPQDNVEIISTNNNNVAQAEQQNVAGSVSNNSTSQFSNQPHYVVDQQHAQTMTQEMIHGMVHKESLQNQQEQQNYHQGVTLPTNVIMQNISAGGDTHQFQQSHHPQSATQQINSPNSSIANALPPQQMTTANMTIPQSSASHIGAESNAASGESSTTEFNNNNQDERNESENYHQQQMTGMAAGGGNLGTNENINISNNNSDNNNITISNDQQPNVSSTPSSSTQAGLSGTAITTDGGDISESASNSVNSNSSATIVGAADEGQTASEDNERILLLRTNVSNKTRKISENRLHYLPHQHIKDRQKLVERSIKSREFSGILKIISGNDNARNLKSMSGNNIEAEQKSHNMRLSVEKVGNSKSNSNLLLFGQYSKTTSSKQKAVEKSSCIGCTPGGLTTTALNMNLTTIGPLCTNVGCIGTSCNSKDANSSTRVSRSASPALGSASENNRF